MMKTHTAQAKISSGTRRQKRNYQDGEVSGGSHVDRLLGRLRTRWYGTRTKLLGGGAMGKKGAMPEPGGTDKRVSGSSWLYL